jgi:hypothetical protein
MTVIRSKYFSAASLIILMLFFLMPWKPCMPYRNLDSSWIQTLTYAFQARLQYGPDLAFVYGPLGFVQLDEYSPTTYPWLLAIRAAVLVLLGFFYFRLLRPLPSIVGAALAVTIVTAATFSREAAFGSAAVVAALVLSEADADAEIVDYLGLALLCGAVSLMKFSYFITISAVFLINALYRALRWREFPVPLALWTVAAFVGYLLSGQHLGSLPEYFRSSFSAATGYGEAMQLFGPPLEAYRFCLLATALLALAAFNGYRDDSAWAIFQVCVLCLVVIVIAKEGFVRHDEAHQRAAVPLLLTTIALCSASMCRRRIDVPALALFLVATCLFFPTVAGVLAQNGTRSLDAEYACLFFPTVAGPQEFLAGATRNVTAIRELAQNGTRSLDAEYEAALARIRSAWPLPRVSGDADIYSYEQGVLLASGNRYHPRPAFQSVTADSKYLIERNVDFLKPPSSAPATIFFDVQPIDGRLAAFEDGASWPELLTRYDITDDTSVFLRLDRRSFPRSYTRSPLLRTTIHLGDILKIENGNVSLLWARIDLQKSMAGAMLAMLIKAPILNLEVTLHDGTSRSFRILPAAAAEGFLLSPIVESRLDFLALDRSELHGYLAKKQVDQIRVAPLRFARMAYRSKVPIMFEKLELKGGSPSAGSNKLAKEVQHLRNLSVMDSGEKNGICMLDFPDGSPEMFAHATSRIVIGAPLSKKMMVRFGIRDCAWHDGNHTDGVEFRISALRAGATLRTLWSRRLTPIQRSADRGVQEVSIELPLQSGERLVFETLPIPGGTTAWAWSYWKDLEFD